MLTVEEAVAQILASVAPLGVEQVLLAEVCGRVLAEDVVASRALPPWDNSAMDGYAVRAADVARGVPLPVVATVGAGHAPDALLPGTAVRIMTGAPVPPGADAIIKREEAKELDASDGGRAVRFERTPAAGDHMRRAGSDLAAGERGLASGALVGPGEIGLLAALGRTVIATHRRPRVAILSTGDELVEPDRAPGPGEAAGKIVGSNAWAIAAQCVEAGALPHVMPIARDDRATLRAAFEEALRADAVISTGGVSVGDFDFVKAALDELGVRQAFWKVAMKPGKPISFGTRDGRPLFGLPGNPASSMVTFELFVRPALRRLLGCAPPRLERPRAPVALDGEYRNAGGRRHFVRAEVRRESARLIARPNARQGSGMLRSMVGVNALVDIPAESTIAAGDPVTALLLEAV